MESIVWGIFFVITLLESCRVAAACCGLICPAAPLQVLHYSAPSMHAVTLHDLWSQIPMECHLHQLLINLYSYLLSASWKGVLSVHGGWSQVGLIY